MAAISPYSSTSTISTAAQREIQVLSRTKSIWITLVVMIVIIIGFVFFINWQVNKNNDDNAANGGAGDSSGTPIAVVGVPDEAFAGSAFEPRDATDREQAEQMITDGDVTTAIVADGNTWNVIEDGGPSTTTLSTISSLAISWDSNQALSALGVSPEQYQAAMTGIEVTGVDSSLDSDEEETDFARAFTAYISLFVIMFTLFLFAGNVGGRVAAEKTSRVVEIILASVRPADFLAGKILGNVIFGFILTALILFVGAAGVLLTGLSDGIEISWGIIGLMMITWLLDMLFFGALYAAAGSLVQRTEDLQSTQIPIMFLVFFSVYIPLFGWTNTDSKFMQVMSWIPPFSIFTGPITYAAGDFSGLQLVGSYILAAMATVGAILLTARIYRNSILNNGKKMSWINAIRG